MLLAEQILMLIRNELVAVGITAYSDYIPDETNYAFTMYELTDTDPTWGFGKDYETITARFNIYSKSSTPYDAISISEQIETIFNRTKKKFTDLECDKHLVCNFKIDDSIQYLDEDERWLITADYQFFAQRNVDCDSEYSSSSSST